MKSTELAHYKESPHGVPFAQNGNRDVRNEKRHSDPVLRVSSKDDVLDPTPGFTIAFNASHSQGEKDYNNYPTLRDFNLLFYLASFPTALDACGFNWAHNEGASQAVEGFPFGSIKRDTKGTQYISTVCHNKECNLSSSENQAWKKLRQQEGIVFEQDAFAPSRASQQLVGCGEGVPITVSFMRRMTSNVKRPLMTTRILSRVIDETQNNVKPENINVWAQCYKYWVEAYPTNTNSDKVYTDDRGKKYVYLYADQECHTSVPNARVYATTTEGVFSLVWDTSNPFNLEDKQAFGQTKEELLFDTRRYHYTTPQTGKNEPFMIPSYDEDDEVEFNSRLTVPAPGGLVYFDSFEKNEIDFWQRNEFDSPISDCALSFGQSERTCPYDEDPYESFSPQHKLCHGPSSYVTGARLSIVNNENEPQEIAVLASSYYLVFAHEKETRNFRINYPYWVYKPLALPFSFNSFATPSQLGEGDRPLFRAPCYLAPGVYSLRLSLTNHNVPQRFLNASGEEVQDPIYTNKPNECAYFRVLLKMFPYELVPNAINKNTLPPYLRYSHS